MSGTTSETPTPTTTTGEDARGGGFDRIHIQMIGRAGWYAPPSRCLWLLDRYPEDFVEQIVAGARCDRKSGAETLPLLDKWPWGWQRLVETMYALHRAAMEAGIAFDADVMRRAMEQFANAEVAPEKYDPREKEREVERERGARRTERRMEQPWRKQHR